MPEQTEFPLANLELVYLNGQEHGGAPVFKDVRLTRDSEKVCEQLLERGAQYDKRIRSESELKRCVDVNKELRDAIAQVQWLGKQEREPWTRILAQIDAGLNGIENRFVSMCSALKKRMSDWAEEVRRGSEKQLEDLKREAHELEQKSKYSSNPQDQRKAKVEAKQKLVEAKQFEQKAMPGFDTVEYHEYEIENRVLAAKLPEEAVSMEPRNRWFDEKIRQAKALGQPEPIFPGIKVTRRTRVRMGK